MLPDVRLVLPAGELDETYVSSLILAYSLHYMKTRHHPHNWKYIIILHCGHWRIKSWPQVICTEIFGKVVHIVFYICKQTHSQTGCKGPVPHSQKVLLWNEVEWKWKTVIETKVVVVQKLIKQKQTVFSKWCTVSNSMFWLLYDVPATGSTSAMSAEVNGTYSKRNFVKFNWSELHCNYNAVQTQQNIQTHRASSYDDMNTV